MGYNETHTKQKTKKQEKTITTQKRLLYKSMIYILVGFSCILNDCMCVCVTHPLIQL